MPAPARRKNPFRFHLLTAGMLALAGTGGLWFALSQQNDWPHWLSCWLVSVNIVAFGYYGYDKGQARGERRRVPEAMLHTLTIAGGSLGSYAGMKLFRHKTIKGKFLIVFWCIVILQVLLALWVARML